MDFKVGGLAKTEVSFAGPQNFGTSYNGSAGTIENEKSNDGRVFLSPPPPSPFHIIGDDTRNVVADTRRFPFRTVCALSFQFRKNGPINRGTGTLIGPNTLLTCAHNCFDFASQTKVIGMDVDPGLTPSGNYDLGRTHANRVFIPDEYKSTNGGEHDYAVIQLADNIGDRLGWLGYREASLNELQNLDVVVTGYPKHDDDPSAKTMYKGTGRVKEVQNQILYHDVDTQGGQSGSAIYSFNDRDGDQYPTIFGIHIAGVVTVNMGVRLNATVLQNIEKWKSA